jgi:circadian clock protein KaiC
LIRIGLCAFDAPEARRRTGGDRCSELWSALTHELRALDGTTLHTQEMPEIMGLELRVPVGGISSLAEVMVLMRYVELRSRLFRLVSMFKVREGAFDPTIREFTITDRGIVVGEPFNGIEAVLSGLAARSVVMTSSEGGESLPGGDTGQAG